MLDRRGLFAALASVLLVAACGSATSSPSTSAPGGGGSTAAPSTGGSGGDSPQRGGTVNLSMFEDADTLDPTYAGTAGAREVFINMCERLYDLNEKGELIPQLAAEMPEVSSDGLSVKIALREGVKFNDGTPMDAAAVVKSLERHRTGEGSRRKSELTSVSGISESGPNAITLTLSTPDAALTATLSDRAGMIMSPTQIDKLGKDFGTSPVCVGPFKFVERVVGDHITLERSDDYYDADKVYLDKVIYHPIPDETVRTANLRSGDLQLVDRLATTDVAAIQGDSQFTVVKVTSNGYTALTVNVANANGIAGEPGDTGKPLADANLRKAFDLALDREQINQIVYNGMQEVGCGPISPASPFYDQEPCPKRDVEAAKQLVAASGATTPIPVEIQVPNSPANVRLGELIQSQTAEAGFAVKVVPMEAATSFQNQNDGKFDIVLTPWSGRVDPNGNVYNFHYSTGTDNFPKAVDPQLDQLLDQAREEYDLAKRKALYKEIVAKVRERRSVIYFQHQNLYAAHTASLNGFQMFVDGMPRLTSAYLTGN